jgi:uncharacterized membrane protein YGL010W
MILIPNFKDAKLNTSAYFRGYNFILYRNILDLNIALKTKHAEMRKIDLLLEEYGESHQNPTNKFIHWICVPLIFFSIVGLFWTIPNNVLTNLFPNVTSPYLNWATVGLLITLFYYFSLSPGLFFGMAVIVMIFLMLTNFLDTLQIAPIWAISLGIFVVACIGQFYGHKVEGKKPSFLKDIQFLMIGPAWLMHFIYKKAGIPY